MAELRSEAGGLHEQDTAKTVGDITAPMVTRAGASHVDADASTWTLTSEILQLVLNAGVGAGIALEVVLVEPVVAQTQEPADKVYLRQNIQDSGDNARASTTTGK